MLPALFLVVLFAGHGAGTRYHGQSGTQQLIARVGQPGASLNGASVRFLSPPLIIDGRTMVPLSETLGMFGLALNLTPTLDSVGGLAFSPDLDHATLNGTTILVPGSLVKRADEYFIRAKLLADAIGARMTSGDHGEFYLTLVRPTEGDAALPQPRFTTDKDIYDIGEPVKIEEFSFDPLGDTIYLHWTNRQPAYFHSGPQTITLEADNRAGHGNRLSRTITVTDRVRNRPLDYGLKFGAIGDLIDDSSTAYPTLPRENVENSGSELLVSDSPEAADRTGALLRDSVDGPFRLLAYHINGSDSPARLCVVVKNVGTEAATFHTVRLGDAAPERIEGVLGQVTLVSFLTDRSGPKYELQPSEAAVIYESPVLPPHAGASLLGDFASTGRFEVSVTMTLGETVLPPDSLAALGPLPRDERHVRGVFPDAIRRFTLDLGGHLPAKAVIGSAADDPAEVGRDPLTADPQTLDGNYGVTYEITLLHAKGVVGALAPRGGLYKGVIVVNDGSGQGLVRAPREGVLAVPDSPMLFMRSDADTVRLQFIPASGSQLPVHLIFYRP